MNKNYQILNNQSDPELQRIKDLSKPYKTVKKNLLIEDEEPILSAINANINITQVYLPENKIKEDSDFMVFLHEKSIPIKVIDNTIFNSIYKGDRKPKVIALAQDPKSFTLQEIDDSKKDFIILAGVKIVGNIGAIIRSALALGAGGLVLVDSDLTTIFDRRLIRSSRGYVFELPVILSDWESLKNLNTRMVLFDTAGEINLDDFEKIPENLGIVFGGEKYGFNENKFKIDKQNIVSIPMNPKAESLNVSVSAGIALSRRINKNLKS